MDGALLDALQDWSRQAPYQQMGDWVFASPDMETVQELMRHASSRLTLDGYAQALTPAKRAAHLKLVGLIHPATETAIGPSWSHADAAVAVSS
jgi:hypothetical protein